MFYYIDRIKSLRYCRWFCLLCCMLAMDAVAQNRTDHDPGLVAPVMNTNPLPKYDNDKLDYGMTVSLERTRKGRFWACWVGGGDNDDAFFVLATSDNNGKTWSKPRLVIDPHDVSLGEKRRTIVGNLWTDPLGRLWLFFDQSMEYFDGRAGNWYSICENPDSENPVWSKPVRFSYGCTLNKPLVLSNGDWAIVVSLWPRGFIRGKYKNDYHELDSVRMANVFVSSDSGKTWKRRGGVRYDKPEFDESHIVEKANGELWMTSRTNAGLFESFSTDKGYTWSPPQASFIKNVSSRHFMRRLHSGRLLMVKHGPVIDQKTKSRSQLCAFLSDDDGKTWSRGLMLDERRGVSYPDGFQAPDGTIYISYDRNRTDDGHVLMARFTEKDVLAGKLISKHSKTKMLISEPGAIEARLPSEIK